jgi:uncharacterized protein YjdB
VTPADASNKAVSWSSSNTAVAKVDQSGKVTAVKAGTATITVTTDDGKKTASCVVTVNLKAGEDGLDNIPQTGDNSPNLLWQLLCAISAASIVTLLIAGKRLGAYRRSE